LQIAGNLIFIFFSFDRSHTSIYADKLNELLFIDGIALDSSTLCAVGEDLIPLPPNKMSVKELRAELAARQCPLLGNKKELVKQLQVS